jgi:hypothetical protein
MQPWVDTDEVNIGISNGGDFFCAPFASSEGDSPMRWPANEVWEVTAADGPGGLGQRTARG